MHPAAFIDAINGNETIILNQLLLRVVIFVIACTHYWSGSRMPCTESAEMKRLVCRRRSSINSHRLLFQFGICVRVCVIFAFISTAY